MNRTLNTLVTSLALFTATASLAAAPALAARTTQASTPRAQATRAAATRASKPKIDAAAKAKIGSIEQSMKSDIAQSSTPFLEFVPLNQGLTMRQTVQADYGNHGAGQKSAAFSLSGIKGGKLSLVVLMPVSGHVEENGKNMASKYAKTNRYNLELESATGALASFSNIKSTGLVTQKQVDFQLTKGKNLLRFWPDGSGGVAGYSSGREIVLNWNGK